MKKTAHRTGSFQLPKTGENKINVYDLAMWSENWVFDAQYRQFSKNTIDNHKGILEKLKWFAGQNNITEIDATALRRFLTYLSESNQRWGNSLHAACQRPASRRTVDTYYGALVTFFNWCVNQQLIETSPMVLLERPLKSRRKIYPFDDGELRSMIKATAKSRYPLRDNSIIHFLLGTGLRATELCQVRNRAIDWQRRKVRVIGKGDKEREVIFGSHTRTLLFNYIKSRGGLDENDYLFVNERGGHFTRSGVLQVVARTGQLAQLKRERVCPHTFRHTFAVKYLIDGGNVFALKELLGHESLEMTNQYVEFTKAFMDSQHRRFAPDDSLYR